MNFHAEINGQMWCLEVNFDKSFDKVLKATLLKSYPSNWASLYRTRQRTSQPRFRVPIDSFVMKSIFVHQGKKMMITRWAGVQLPPLTITQNSGYKGTQEDQRCYATFFTETLGSHSVVKCPFLGHFLRFRQTCLTIIGFSFLIQHKLIE